MLTIFFSGTGIFLYQYGYFNGRYFIKLEVINTWVCTYICISYFTYMQIIVLNVILMGVNTTVKQRVAGSLLVGNAAEHNEYYVVT